ncbi:VOC family protein [Rhizobium sp. CFBP 8762]|uniref:VOC family protein n=1 Tax=Rhizobium sp. CFBP 8762 TaxID=2775279 RepID=UPI00177E21D8|nr:VOC family protein [Rhizobium sp. CFBP 8762]MBD8554144.1 VOC family protein [Rhizobium sp. CFBP 8762]
MAKSIHTMIRVLDESRSIAFYQQAFGLSVVERMEFDAFTLIYMANAESEFEVELTVNKDRTDPYVMGDGYGHLAVSVDDLDQAHRELTESGLQPGPVRTLQCGREKFARFFFVTDPDGYKIEVLNRGGRFK